MALDFNPVFQKALTIIETTNQSLFLTGRAGTGKSTLLTYFRETTKKKVVVLAPTGVAALNVKGQTIHSFFKFKPDITLQGVKANSHKNDERNIYKQLDTIIIDEISMVRADLLDCVDKSLKLNRSSHAPFGGVQMIFIGDLYQLPPVITGSEREIFKTAYQSPFFFDAHVFSEIELTFLELEKIYRQKDVAFIELLNAVRNNSVTDTHLQSLNERYEPDYIPSAKKFFLYLTTTNAQADLINAEQLAKLATPQQTFEGSLTGTFENRAMPTDSFLSLKKGAQIMMLNNDSAGRWVNGTIGKIIDIIQKEEEEQVLRVALPENNIVEVTQFTWELFQFEYDSENKRLEAKTVGTFTQYPLRLAWAVTIHKSQGKTFDQIIIDLGRGTFVHGQLYVALSRCTSLAGIVLKQQVTKKHIMMDWRVVRFITKFQYARAESDMPLAEKVRILEKAAGEQSAMEIVYLKANDEKSKRIIIPYQIGTMEFKGKQFLGMSAYDKNKKEDRVFRVDRILTLQPMQTN